MRLAVSFAALSATLSFGCAPNTPEAWSRQFADAARQCGTATQWTRGDGAAVFACMNDSIERRIPFTAGTDVAFPRSMADYSEGRVVGVMVEGTYETFTFTEGAWRGPCVSLETGFGPSIAGAACHLRMSAAPPVGVQTRTFTFDIPTAHVGVIPWER